MKKIISLVILSISMPSISSAEVWQGGLEYTSYVISANSGRDVVFRFSGPGHYTPCETGAEFTKAHLIKLDEWRNEREYFLKPETTATGSTGLCDDPNAMIPTIAYSQTVKSKWKYVPAGDVVTIIMSSEYEVELR